MNETPKGKQAYEALLKRNYLLAQPHKSFNKLFGIGANKTGSTSLKLVFSILGLRAANQNSGELTTQQLAKGNFAPLIKYVEQYDAFQDTPFAAKSYYAQLDALFPNSKFILTIREPEAWFDSFLRHNLKQLDLDADKTTITAEDLVGKDYLYHGFRQLKFESDWLLSVDQNYTVEKCWDLSFDKNHFIDLYLQRNKEIVRHFSERPDDLLVIDITKEPTTEKIVNFLNLPEALITDMPHLNQNLVFPQKDSA
ncbi:sulfotransferase [Neptuniibacter sp.]|uniref:sulfotransferase n=1 Tax=Neptuniibacter sp. TaxID=1962643 RepID=UPI002608B624|nr:sulfotransferase [Neptuniibacter sp.]MCP4596861.1 hypothetical protein [Neptuniibacter sp.]